MNLRTSTDYDRGQLSLSVVEAGIGVILVFGVTSGFILGVPSPDTREVQLTAYANDAATVLAGEGPRHQGATRLAEVSISSQTFEREQTALERRIGRILPDNLMFRVETPNGAVGYAKPAGVAVGRATVSTVEGEVTIWVWYV